MTSDTDIAWLAGILDGEGQISLFAGKRLDDSQPPSILTRVKVVNTNRALLEKTKAIVSALVGREIRYGMNGRPRPEWKQAYNLNVSKQTDIRSVLEATLPYLSAKLPQAQIMLRYLDIAPGRGGGDGNGPSIKYEERHWQLMRDIQSLNFRGAPKGNTEGSPLSQGDPVETTRQP